MGQNETIKALANFQFELNGAFLRLSAKRDKFESELRESEGIEKSIQSTQEKLNFLSEQMTKARLQSLLKEQIDHLQSEFDHVNQKLKALQTQDEEIGRQLMQKYCKPGANLDGRGLLPEPIACAIDQLNA